MFLKNAIITNYIIATEPENVLRLYLIFFDNFSKSDIIIRKYFNFRNFKF